MYRNFEKDLENAKKHDEKVKKALASKTKKDNKRAKDKKKVVVNNHKNGRNMTAEAKKEATKYQDKYIKNSKLSKDMFDQNEDYIEKFKKGNILGGAANFVGAGLTGAQSIYLNALNNADSLVHGDGLQDFKYNMSNDDYQRAVVDRRGGGDTINEMADKKSPVLGAFVRTVGEVATDPLELTPFGTYNDIKTAKQGVKSVGYAKDLQKSKLVGEGTYKPTVEVNKPRVTKTPQAKAKDFRANVVEKGNEATKNISNEKASVMSLKPTAKSKKIVDEIAESANTTKGAEKTVKSAKKSQYAQMRDDFITRNNRESAQFKNQKASVMSLKKENDPLNDLFDMDSMPFTSTERKIKSHSLKGKARQTFETLEAEKNALEEQFNSLFEQELKNNAELIRNYEKKGVTYDYTPRKDYMDLGWESKDVGFYTRHSNNEQWYQDFYKESGRPPAKKEAEKIAREHLYEDMERYMNNPDSVGDMELGASGELKAMYEKMVSLEKQQDNVIKNGYASTDDILKNNDFMNSLVNKYGGVDNAAKEMDNASSFDDFIAKEYKEYKLKPNGADVNRIGTKTSYIEKYGEMDRGIPKATPFGDVSQSAKTIANSPLLDAKTRRAVKANIDDFTKVTVSNKTVLDNAEKAIADRGADKIYDTFTENFKRGDAVTSQNIADGYKLAEHYINIGDTKKAEEVLSNVAMMESEAGRTLQSMRMFNAMTPTGRVSTATRMARKMSNKAGKKIVIPKDLLDNLSKAKTEGDVARANKAISVYLWNNVPSSFTEKLNAWRYLAMLGNPKTHIRNILGNALFVPARTISDSISAVMEKALPQEMRVHSLTRDKEIGKIAAREFKDDIDLLKNNSKYIDVARDLDSKVYQGKLGIPLEKVRQFNADMLDKEDGIFMGIAYKRAFNEFCTAKGIKASDMTDDILAQAKEYARNEALYSTYRDYSKAAETLNSLKRNAQIPLKEINADTMIGKVAKKGVSTLVEGTVPFTKTPINILKRGVAYSPVNLAKGVGDLAYSIKKSDPERTLKAIDEMAKGLTGTGVAILGYFLGSQGFAIGSMEDGKETDFRKQQGDQEYSINYTDPITGQTYNVTMDWATPLSMTLFTGVELQRLLDEQGFGGYQILDILKGLPEPLLNLSMLSGVENAFDTQFSTKSNAVDILTNMANGYISQFMPTLLSQIARTATEETRTTTSTEENKEGRSLERFVNKLENKIPILTDTNQPYVDMWGNTENKYNAQDYIKSGLENFLSPAYINQKHTTVAEEELNNLNNSIGTEVLPTSINKYSFKFDGKEYRMSEEELTQYKKDAGQISQRNLVELFNSNEYDNMTDKEKKNAIVRVYSDAKDSAKEGILKGRGVSQGEIDYGNLTDIMRGHWNDNLGITKGEYADLLVDANTNGKRGYTADELTTYLNKQKWSRATKAKVFDLLSNAKHNPYA